MKNRLQSFIYVFSSHIFSFLLGVLTAFLLPKYTSTNNYGYWQLFLMYSSYVGIAIFGYCDGIYIDVGGKGKDDLNPRKFSTLHLILLFYTVLIALLFGTIIWVLRINIYYKMIFIGVSFIFILQSLNSYFQLINQATNNLKMQSIISFSEKAILTIFIFVLLILNKLEIQYLILFSVITKAIVLLIYYITNYKFIFRKPIFNFTLFKEVKKYIKLGLPLTIYGIFSMLMTGGSKILVENQYDINTFAIFAFSFSAMSLVGQLIHSISMVLYPYFSNTEDKIIIKFFDLIEKNFSIITIVILLVFYPIVFIINTWLSKYIPSIEYLNFLFPMLIFQFKISGLYNIAFKVKKNTKLLLKNVSISLTILVVIIVLGYFTKLSISFYSLATVFAYFIWYILSIREFNKLYKHNVKYNYFELLFILIFYIFNIFKIYVIGLVFYIFVFIYLLLYNRNNYIDILRKLY